MAIDIQVRDGVDSNIEKRLRGIGAAARDANGHLNNLQKALSSNKSSGGLSSIANDIEKALKPKSTKAVESALVTRAKELAKERAEITLAFEKGFREQDKRNSALTSVIERATRGKKLDYADLLGIKPETTAKAQRDMQKFYDDVFGAHNITTSNTLSKNIANTVAQATGTGLKQASERSRAATQKFYDDMFGGSYNLITKPQKGVSIKDTISQNTGLDIQKRTASDLKAQQAAYDSLFGAIKKTDTAQQGFTRSLMSYFTSAKNAKDGTQGVSSAFERLETSTSFLRSDGLRWAKVMWAIGGATLTAGAIVQAADAYTRLQNRLSLVAEGQQSVNMLTKEMGNIAISTRQPVESVTKLYTRLDLAMKQMGKGQETTGKLTESIAMALQLTGATAGEASSAMLQLSQAFNKGKLDGDEFRTMMEGAPILADALAKKLGVLRGDLLKLAPKGKLTAEVMTAAWTEALPKIRKAFDDTRTTIEQGFNIFRTQMTLYLGALDKSLGFTNALSKGIVLLGDNLDVLAFTLMAVAPILAVFVGSKILVGLVTMTAYISRTSASIAGMGLPVRAVTVKLYELTKAGVSAGISMTSAMTTAAGRATILSGAIARVNATLYASAALSARAGSALLMAFSPASILMFFSVATAAALAFGDAMVVNTEKGITMRDYTIAAFSVMADYISKAFNDTFDEVHKGMDGVAKKSETTGGKVIITMSKAADGTALFIDSVLTMFNWIGQGIVTLTTAVLQTIQNIIKSIINLVSIGINAVTDVINLALSGYAKLASFAGTIGNMFGGNYDTDVVAPQISQIAMLKVGYEETAAAAKLLNDQQAIGVDIAQRSLQQYKKDVAAKAAAIAKERGTGTLRADDPTQAALFKKSMGAGDDDKAAKKALKDAERRATIISKVVHEQDRLIKTSQLLGDEVEKVNALEELNNKLIEKKYPQLSAGEREYIGNLIQTRIQMERVGQAAQKYYDIVTKPLRDHATEQSALTRLLGTGVIDDAQYNAFLQKSIENQKMLTDSTFESKKALEDQLRTFGKFGAEASAAEAVYKAIDKQGETGSIVTAKDAQDIAENARALYDLQQRNSAMNDVLNATALAAEKSNYAITALAQAYKAGGISADYFVRNAAKALSDASLSTANAQGMVDDPFEALRLSMYRLVGEMPSAMESVTSSISTAMSNALDSTASTLTEMIMNFDAYAEKTAEALGRPVSTLDTLRYAIGSIVKQVGTELVGAFIKMGIQMAIQAAMSKSIEAASSASTIATQNATAATVEAAWSGAALMAAIATNGAASTTGFASLLTAKAGLVATNALTKASSVAGFANGSGIIVGKGTSMSDSLLANVSAGEMVMNANAVDKNRSALMAMQHGAEIGVNSGGNVNNIEIHYHSDGGRTSKQSSGDDKEFMSRIISVVQQEIIDFDRDTRQQGNINY